MISSHLLPMIRRQRANKLEEEKTMKNGLRHTVFFPGSGVQYTGQWLENLQHGQGTQKWTRTGLRYDGQWRAGKRDGFGALSKLSSTIEPDELIYFGDWKNDQKVYGMQMFNGNVYKGEWQNGKPHGQGSFWFQNGNSYVGEWENGKKHGHGIFDYRDNSQVYVGKWENGMKNGPGILYYVDKGLVYEGVWVDDIPKCGAINELEHEHATRPMKNLIPLVMLQDAERVLQNALAEHLAARGEEMS